MPEFPIPPLLRRRHTINGTKNILKEIWSDCIAAALAAFSVCRQDASAATSSRCRLAFQDRWKWLNDDVDGNLIPAEFPIEGCIQEVDGADCKSQIANIKNPYYIGE